MSAARRPTTPAAATKQTVPFATLPCLNADLLFVPVLCPAGSDEEMADADAADAGADAPAEEADRTVGSGRQAAQGKVYKDQKAPKTQKSDKVKDDKGVVVESENEAWEQTKPEEGADSRTRRWGRGERAGVHVAFLHERAGGWGALLFSRAFSSVGRSCLPAHAQELQRRSIAVHLVIRSSFSLPPPAEPAQHIQQDACVFRHVPAILPLS